MPAMFVQEHDINLRLHFGNSDSRPPNARQPATFDLPLAFIQVIRSFAIKCVAILINFAPRRSQQST